MSSAVTAGDPVKKEQLDRAVYCGYSISNTHTHTDPSRWLGGVHLPGVAVQFRMTNKDGAASGHRPPLATPERFPSTSVRCQPG
ncbi:hypothetical protein RRG08_031056 [Elysia crispata]|uniref:Uncharacterized protein n=1 Tax=Elysia crispata TaxID=231223 RepID=A0AAE0ZF99_9GAST|nr:hypothetical protein RRG08_031056 [Elysia crispata]